MAQSNQEPGGGKHNDGVLGDPEINNSTDLTGSVENESIDHTGPGRPSKARRTPVATLIILVALTLLLAACNAVAASSIPTPTALATVMPPATGPPTVVKTSTPAPTTTGTPVPATSPTASVAPGATI